jgi:tetratricopeptide (TPR) repeat protein
MEWSELISSFEQQIRQGKGAAVKKHLWSSSLTEIPRQHYGMIANIATRVGFPTFTLKLLTREIRKSNFEKSNLSVFERAEYASALTNIGAFSEAEKILESLNPNSYPKILLYESFALFNQWKYREALPHLQNYVKKVEEPYLKRVGKVNLCAAQVFCRDYAKALESLKGLQAELVSEKQTLLLGNVLELQAQCYLGLERFAEADQTITQSEELLSGTGTLFYLFAKKWRAISSLMQNKKEAKSQIAEVRQMAKGMRHFETLRECDFFEGIYLNDAELVRKVYFGSPFSSYREKILAHVPIGGTQYDWTVEVPGTKDSPLYDVAQPIEGVVPNSILHNLQKLFFSDFYATWRIGTVFSNLFPDNHYDIQSSPNRIYQLIHRWNVLAEKSSLPFAIESDGSGFRVVFKQSCTVRVGQSTELINIVDSQLQQLRLHFGSKSFRSAEARKLLNKSQSHMSVLLTKAQAVGLQKLGSGKATLYKFAA